MSEATFKVGCWISWIDRSRKGGFVGIITAINGVTINLDYLLPNNPGFKGQFIAGFTDRHKLFSHPSLFSALLAVIQ